MKIRFCNGRFPACLPRNDNNSVLTGGVSVAMICRALGTAFCLLEKDLFERKNMNRRRLLLFVSSVGAVSLAGCASSQKGDKLVGEGTHVRFIVDRERFLAKL